MLEWTLVGGDDVRHLLLLLFQPSAGACFCQWARFFRSAWPLVVANNPLRAARPSSRQVSVARSESSLEGNRSLAERLICARRRHHHHHHHVECQSKSSAGDDLRARRQPPSGCSKWTVSVVALSRANRSPEPDGESDTCCSNQPSTTTIRPIGSLPPALRPAPVARRIVRRALPRALAARLRPPTGSATC